MAYVCAVCHRWCIHAFSGDVMYAYSVHGCRLTSRYIRAVDMVSIFAFIITLTPATRT